MAKRKRSDHHQEVAGTNESKRARTDDITNFPTAAEDEIAENAGERAFKKEGLDKAARREAKQQRKALRVAQREKQLPKPDQGPVETSGPVIADHGKERAKGKKVTERNAQREAKRQRKVLRADRRQEKKSPNQDQGTVRKGENGATDSANGKTTEKEAADRAVRREAKRQRRALKEHQREKQSIQHDQGPEKTRVEAQDQFKTPRKKRKRSRDLSAEVNGNSLLNQELVSHSEKQNDREGGSSAVELAKEGSIWKISDTIGGHILDIDPIFSVNEEYFLVAYQSHVAVYATSTSLLSRSLHMRKGCYVASMALSPVNENRIYVTTTVGLIELWDWNEGKKLRYWDTKRETQHLQAIKQSQESDRIILFTTHKMSDISWQVSAHLLRDSQDSNNREQQPLFTHDRILSSLRVLEDAAVIVMTSGEQLIIGNQTGPRKSGLDGMNYTWRIVTCHEWISSIDVRVKPSEAGKKDVPLRRPDSFVYTDIVVGGLKGGIRIYDDLLHELVRQEKSSKGDKSVDIRSRQLHWHRSAVLAVKWSRDGNYIISGGQETVLVMWQLDTGRKETLPHLGAPIEGLVVSPGGSSYGIRLADNSAMILSTSELRPFFSIAGIQAPVAFRGQPNLPPVPTVDHSYRMSGRVESSHPVCVCSSRPGQILLAVPPFTSSRVPELRSQNASYLQTFDVGSTHQISRQALARTNVTNLNMGPESNAIEEPNVTHIMTSEDGQWLASVDEWMPPARDLAAFAFNSDREYEERLLRQETHLKFWSWSTDSKDWELVSRIDRPHASDSGNAYEGGRVLALAADPNSVGFSTFGENGFYKAWKPVTRRRNGNDVKGKDGQALVNWHFRYNTPIMPPIQATADERVAAKLAYSPDSSVVVLGLRLPTPSPIYLLDGFTGEIQSIKTGLYTGPLLGLGILDRYLIVLSNELIVWDLVDDELHYGVDLDLPAVSFSKIATFSNLAIDTQHKTLAVSVPEISSRRHRTEVKSRIAVFRPADIEPLLVTQQPNAITALLPAVGRKGYYAIDTAAEVRTLSPGQSLPSLPLDVPKLEKQPALGLNGIFGSQAQEGNEKPGRIAEQASSVIRQSPVDIKDEVFVSEAQLAEVFDRGPSYALPPVSELFEQVALLFNGRPKDVVT